ncbi:hypothetical protein ABII15_14945 [Streptomyces sp. HUAS MG91]|uniref:Ankyrin n=1 Tax=Streptomyces tabacisoli TaxID=3156398 RepID=A0AAU8ISE1_9ACTN
MTPDAERDLNQLRAAVGEYRAAATAAGLDWPAAGAAAPRPHTDGTRRLLAVDRIGEQPLWLHSQGWRDRRLLPNGGWLPPWPPDPSETLDILGLSTGTPFPWRAQLPLFHFGFVVFTYVLDEGPYEGEVWRYEIAPDAYDAVRAAPNLSALFAQWTRGITEHVIRHDETNDWLAVDDEALLQLAPTLDPFAFPVSVAAHPLLRERQRACGVDLDSVDRGFDSQEELWEEIDAVRKELGLP